MSNKFLGASQFIQKQAEEARNKNQQQAELKSNLPAIDELSPEDKVKLMKGQEIEPAKKDNPAKKATKRHLKDRGEASSEVNAPAGDNPFSFENLFRDRTINDPGGTLRTQNLAIDSDIVYKYGTIARGLKRLTGKRITQASLVTNILEIALIAYEKELRKKGLLAVSQ